MQAKYLYFITFFVVFGYGLAQSAGSDLTVYIQNTQNQMKLARDQVNQLAMEKGHDPRVAQLLAEADQALDEAQANIKKLQEVTKLASDIKRNMALARIKIDQARNAPAIEPKEYPERCLVLTLDDKGREKAKKAGLMEKTGIVETFGGPNTWVLTVGNPNAPEGVDRFMLHENVGLIGSSDPSSALLVRGHTPQDMSVTGWVDIATKKAMCISQPMKIQ